LLWMVVLVLSLACLCGALGRTNQQDDSYNSFAASCIAN